MSRDEILGLPDDGLEFREWWQEITGRRRGSPLVERLGKAVAAGTLGGLTSDTEERWKEVASQFGKATEADSLDRAIVCARLAMAEPEDGTAMSRLCEKLSWPRTVVAESLVIDRTHWPTWLRGVIDQSPEGSLLRPSDASFSPAMAWDLVTRFWARCADRVAWERRPLRSRRLVSLLVDCRLEKTSSGKFEYVQDDVTAELKLELLPQGTGQLYPDPGSLLFVKLDESFRGALESAREAAQTLLGANVGDLDVRWNLTRHDDRPLTELSQDSAGAAFALALAALWARSTDKLLVKRLQSLELSKVGVTATLRNEPLEGWRLGEVAGIEGKLRDAAQRPDKVRVVCVARDQPRDALPNLRVVEASTLRELVNVLYKEPKERRKVGGPGWYLGIGVAVLVVAGVYSWVQERQTEWLFSLRKKALFSLAPGRYSKAEVVKAFARLHKDPLSDAFVLIHDRDFTSAILALEKAKAQGLSSNPLYHSLMGDYYYHQNRFESAVPFYRQAAAMAGPEDTDSQIDLAVAVGRSRGDDATLRIEEALRIYRTVIAELEGALKESGTWGVRATRLREKWACAHLDLAGLLVDRPRFEIRSVSAGLISLEKARTVFTRDAYEEAWAGVTATIGVGWLNRRDGNRAENLATAIRNLQDAKEVFQRYGRALRVGHHTYLIGYAKAQLRAGDRANNIEEALRLYDAAERILKGFANDYPALLAVVQRMRGLALMDRRLGDRDANLEQAIAAFEAALGEFARLGEEIDAAKTMNDMGRALLLRNRTSRREDVEKAIEYLQKAARVFDRKKFPMESAQVLNDLGAAFRERLEGDSAANLERSRQCYERALSLRTGAGRADQLVVTENGLGLTMLAMKNTDGDTAVRGAITLFDDALAERGLSKEEAPEYPAETSRNLGDAWSAIAHGDRAANRAMAAEHYRVAEQYYASRPYYAREHRYVLGRLEALP